MTKTLQSRSAFSMITAIFVILIMSSVAAFIMSLSGKLTQETTTQYRKEQAILYAKSYTEFAVMSATSQDCIRRITANIGVNANKVLLGEGYFVEVDIQYIGNELNGIGACSPTNILGNLIVNPQSKGTVILVDTYVHYRDPDNPNTTTANNWDTYPGITYHRRTLQRL